MEIPRRHGKAGGMRPRHGGVMTTHTAAQLARAQVLHCDPGMLLPEGKTCSDCVSIARCTAFVARTGTETHCDWHPSRFRENFGAKVEALISERDELVEALRAAETELVTTIRNDHESLKRPAPEADNATVRMLRALLAKYPPTVAS